METPQAVTSRSSGKAPTGGFRESLVNAARFWERKRLYYNFILTAVVVGWVVATWPHFRPAFTLDALLKLTVLALLANVCYSAAYLVDIALQRSKSDASVGAEWKADLGSQRWVLWFMGTALAFVFENYWIADEIYPDVH